MIFASLYSQLQAERKFRPATDYTSSLGTKFASKHLKSSHDTSPYRFTLKFEAKFVNLSRRDPYLKNAKLKNVRRGSALAPLERAVGLEWASASLR